MELKFSKISARDSKTAVMRLYGALGSGQGQINGHYFAEEMSWLCREYDDIVIKVNCEGGSVSHGLSILSEMSTSTSFITVHVTGIAASMGSGLLPAADKVIMNDYARIMIHSPYYVDENGEALKTLTPVDKKALANYKGIFTDLLKKRGIPEDKVLKMLKNDTWFDASAAMDENLVDEIVDTGKKELAAMEPKKLVALVYNNFKSETNMKKVIAKLNSLGAKLEDNATDEQVVVAIGEFVKPATPDVGANDKLVAMVMKAGRAAGVINDDNEASYTKLAKKDIELFAEMFPVDSLVKSPEGGDGGERTETPSDMRLSDVLAHLQGGGNAPKKEKWEDYSQKELEELENKQPEVYATLYKGYYGVELKLMK